MTTKIVFLKYPNILNSGIHSTGKFAKQLLWHYRAKKKVPC